MTNEQKLRDVLQDVEAYFEIRRNLGAAAEELLLKVREALSPTSDEGMPTETPLTDSVMELAENLKPGTVVVRVHHARQLERTLDWPHTMDAKVWAEEFAKVYPMLWQEGGAINDVAEVMLGWFANAIMAGYDTAVQRLNATPPPATPRGDGGPIGGLIDGEFSGEHLTDPPAATDGFVRVPLLTPGETPRKNAAFDAWYATIKNVLPHEDGSHISGAYWVALMEGIKAYIAAAPQSGKG